jgi:hypothetical protein
MRRSKFTLTLFLFAGFIFVSGMAQSLQAQDTGPVLYPADLITMLDRPDVVILDVRAGASWDLATTKISGAIRESPDVAIDTWIGKYVKYKTYLLYCS